MGNNNFKMYENLAILGHVGILMIVPIFGGVYIGNWLDERFQTGGILLLICIVFGTLTAFRNLLVFAMKKGSNNKRK